MHISTALFLLAIGAFTPDTARADVQVTLYVGPDPSYGLTYDMQVQGCEMEGQRLCTLSELCPTRGSYTFPFEQEFPLTNLYSDTISYQYGNYFAAYKTTEDNGANCNVDGNCDGNSWVQIGVGAQGLSQANTCNTHCEIIRQEESDYDLSSGTLNQCPEWGNSSSELSNFYVCCSDSTATVVVSSSIGQ